MRRMYGQFNAVLSSHRTVVFIFSMSVTARSVQPPPQQLLIGRRSCRRKGRGAGYEVRTKKLYRGMWSFLKTGAQKQPEAENTCQNLHRQQKLLFRNPCINV
ncbi:MAG: hypothetical protein ACLR2G_04945 [Phascolarctobacterium faecium]